MNTQVSAQIRALQTEREALQLRRQQLEKRYEAKLVTSKDITSVHAHMLKRRLRKLKLNQGRVCPLLDQTNQATREVLSRVEAVVNVKHPSRVALDKEQLAYLSKVEELYPRHRSELEAANVRMLRDMEEEERLIAKRAADAKASFDKEVTMKGLLVEQRQKLNAAKEREAALAKLRDEARAEMKTNDGCPQAKDGAVQGTTTAFGKASEAKVRLSANVELEQKLAKEDVRWGFEWKTVLNDTLLPTYLETQTRSNGQRLVRLPHTFTLRVAIPEHKSVVLHARRKSSVVDLIKQVEAASQLRIQQLVLGKGTKIDGHIEQFGESLFKENIHAVIKASSLPWARLTLILERAVDMLQRDSRVPELRNTKYGLIRHGGRQVDTSHVIDALALDTCPVDCRYSVFELIETLKEVVSLQSHSLLPESLWRSTEILNKAKVEQSIQDYHDSFSDGRENAWRLLVKHWRWATNLQILTPDQVANVFVSALCPDESEVSSNRLWQVIEVLSSRSKPESVKASSTRVNTPSRSVHNELSSPTRRLSTVSLSQESKETDESSESTDESGKHGTTATTTKGGVSLNGPQVLAHLEEFSDVEDDFDLLETAQAEENDIDF